MGKNRFCIFIKSEKGGENPIDRRKQATVANFINHSLPLPSCRASPHPHARTRSLPKNRIVNERSEIRYSRYERNDRIPPRVVGATSHKIAGRRVRRENTMRFSRIWGRRGFFISLESNRSATVEQTGRVYVWNTAWQRVACRREDNGGPRPVEGNMPNCHACTRVHAGPPPNLLG